ncbi:MAG: pimeloyl-ACP methyl ester carboxylesterase [Pseudomonadales bacterium]|jgi:pimeloyl-ACP methyl ester carboxylesterase
MTRLKVIFTSHIGLSPLGRSLIALGLIKRSNSGEQKSRNYYIKPSYLMFFLFTSFLLSACQSNAINVAKSDTVVASITELTIESHGSRIPGLAYLAAGSGPHPTVLLLHGYPGNEKNLDVAQALRRNGWNVVFFHYRGAWGSEGEFSFRNSEQDVHAVLNYMRDPANAKTLRIDPERISIVGHSMGGHMAIAGILDNQNVRCAIAYDGANMGAKGKGLFNVPEAAAMWSNYSDTLFMLQGWSGAKAMQEINEYGRELDLVTRANQINGRPVLLIAADTDVIPIDLHITPLLDALAMTDDSNTHYLLIDDDHSFSSSRLELIEATEGFLNQRCR